LYYSRTRKLLFSLAIAVPIISASSLLFILRAEGNVNEPQILEKHRVVVMADDHNITVDTHAGTVGEVLEQLRIDMGKQDLVEPAALTKLSGNTQIRVTRISQNEIENIEEIPFTTVTYDDPELLIGQEQVIQEGVSGKERVRKSLRVENGMSVTEKILSRRVISPYIPKVVAVGTAVPAPVQVLEPEPPLMDDFGGPSDETIPSNSTQGLSNSAPAKPKVITIEARPVNYKFQLDEVELTAYTAGFESTGKNPGDPDYGITSSGTTVSEGRTIAVDPTVIPMGWWVYIDGIGYRKAEDTGSAIKGNIIDVFIEDLEKANKFGRKRGYTVYVIGPKKPN
jgi:3D (Asp-Asp-Asp) domain-containing protein